MTETTAETAPLPSNDAGVIALIGLAHGTSHFFHLLLPALFPWLMPAFGLDFSGIGLTMTLFFVVSGVGQAFAGFAVDRWGPVRVLLFGMACFVASGVWLGLAASVPADLFVVAALAGLGNSVFHPADYSVLNHKVSAARLSHAFSVHGLSGNLGWALAPVLLTGVAAAADWRAAALVGALVALPAMLLLGMRRKQLDWTPEPEAHRDAPAQGGSFAFLGVAAVWLCFAFSFFLTTAFGAIQNYATPILRHLYDLSLATAALAVSTYMLAAAAGIFLGGFVAQRHAQDRIIAFALLAAAAQALVLALQVLPGWAVLPMIGGIGFCSGIAGPSRDLLIRSAATGRFGKAAYGRIYGFVYSGLDAGLAVAPIVFGPFMDAGRDAVVLAGIAVFQTLAVFTAIRVGSRT